MKRGQATCSLSPLPKMDLAKALELFGFTDQNLADPVIRQHVEEKRRELLTIWHPHRYAMVTNNPRKYMAKYKQAETMTKDIHAAYALLIERLEKKDLSKS